MATLVLGWVIDCPVQAISLISVTYVLAGALGLCLICMSSTLGIHITQSPHACVTTITCIGTGFM